MEKIARTYASPTTASKLYEPTFVGGRTGAALRAMEEGHEIARQFVQMAEGIVDGAMETLGESDVGPAAREMRRIVKSELKRALIQMVNEDYEQARSELRSAAK